MVSDRFQRRIERLLDEADEAIAQFDWEKVRQCAQAVLALEPNNSDGMGLLAALAQEAFDLVAAVGESGGVCRRCALSYSRESVRW